MTMMMRIKMIQTKRMMKMTILMMTRMIKRMKKTTSKLLNLIRKSIKLMMLIDYVRSDQISSIKDRKFKKYWINSISREKYAKINRKKLIRDLRIHLMKSMSFREIKCADLIKQKFVYVQHLIRFRTQNLMKSNSNSGLTKETNKFKTDCNLKSFLMEGEEDLEQILDHRWIRNRMGLA